MPATSQPQEFSFQAEIQQLLHLLSHSLYQSRDIVLRELISNASDALDKMRHISLVDASRRECGPLEITLEVDADAHTIRIRDTGVGMTRDELVENLGTIARSGSLEFLKTLGSSDTGDLSLIGQFGVGFYSAFMIADTVEVLTRGYQEESGWLWRSQGHGTFEISPADDAPRGAQITLHLKKDSEELADPDYVRGVVRTYSSFVQHPIKLDGEVINSQKPIWVEPPSQLTDDDYARFYQHLSHRPEDKPLWRLHVSVDSPIQFHAVLFCPPTNLEQLGLGRQNQGLSLCAKRILVQNDCRELLPGYLRFLCGLVDSEDLPLNVSRETLQDNTVFRRIRTTLVNQTHTRLQKLADDDPAGYAEFYRQFGSTLREGIVTDLPAREKIAKLLRFGSSHGPTDEALTSLDEYIQRAPADQRQIYFIGGPDLATLKKNPNLEVFAKCGLEVLFLTDTVDEFLLTDLGEYDGHPLTSVDAADVELPESAADKSATDDTEQGAEEPSSEQPTAGLPRVLTLFRSALQDHVQEVRESKRLTDSPCCLVNPTGGMSTQMQKLVQLSNSEAQFAKRILEVNAKAPLIKRLCALGGSGQHDEFIQQCAQQLFDNALILEGLSPEPRDLVSRVQGLMEELAQSKSPIIH